ncbi:MAG: hypothetical protein LBQ48_06710 [Oscillospiraceae bacterium]|jgi:predicted Zn-ribbon and HTH transcriptional regulator|nr:hypothetical protein [Oscillospiraceae bacterium]
MKMVANGSLTREALEKIRRHSDGVDRLKSRLAVCHFCGHHSIKLFEDSRGHVQAKCSVCKRESVYNAVLCRNGAVRFRLPPH